MSVRIRYKKVGEVLVSPQFLAVNQMVMVNLYPDLLEVEVIGADGAVLFRSDKQTNTQNMKKVAKKRLVELGVNFIPEVRPRFADNSEEVLKKAELFLHLNGK